MKALLDTHTFLWGISGDRRMSHKAHDVFVGPSDLVLSMVSIWEILIKVQLRKLNLPEPAGPYVLRKLTENRIETLPIELNTYLCSKASLCTIAIHSTGCSLRRL
jgi:PIN domain nuclease of toxin-antitoxin system